MARLQVYDENNRFFISSRTQDENSRRFFVEGKVCQKKLLLRAELGNAVRGATANDEPEVNRLLLASRSLSSAKLRNVNFISKGK